MIARLRNSKLVQKVTCQVKLLYYGLWHYKVLRKLKCSQTANVVFFASTLGMWRYQKLYEKLKSDDRFNCRIVIVPFKAYSLEDQKNNVQILSDYFLSKRISYIDGYKNIENTEEWLKEFNPDILFYPQPYSVCYGNKLDSKNFYKKLCCYYPYGLYTLCNPVILNNDYQNFGWKVFLQTRYHIEDARHYMRNHGKNVVLTGDVNTDYYLSNKHNDPWKPQSKKKKRIIWAPHFTIIPNFLLHRDSFLWMNQVILDFANNYKDLVQIAFKPHPRLKTELYGHPDWGKEKADAYYEIWRNLENGQLEEGEFIDLFCTSDAIIHDSGSFIADYLFTGKPAIFTSRKKEDAYKGLNQFGKLCMDCHYHAEDTKKAVEFLENIVLTGVDPLSVKRLEFRDSVLIINANKTVAQTTYEDILEGLGWFIS